MPLQFRQHLRWSAAAIAGFLKHRAARVVQQDERGKILADIELRLERLVGFLQRD